MSPRTFLEKADDEGGTPANRFRPMLRLLPVILLVTGCDPPAASNTLATVDADIESSPPSAAIRVAQSPRATAAERHEPSTGLPADVRAFKARRDECDHFRGEEAGDDARAAELARKLEQICTGTDKELAALRRRHADDAAAIAALGIYEDRVE